MVRLKHRYLTVHVLYPTDTTRAQATAAPLLQFHRPSPAGVDAAQLLRLIRRSVEYMYGDYGLGLVASSLKINYWSAATSTAIVRVTRNHFRILWGALTWITDIGRNGGYNKENDRLTACVFRVVRTSGTIRKAEEDVIRRAKEEILRAKRVDGGNYEAGLIGSWELSGTAITRGALKHNVKGLANIGASTSEEEGTDEADESLDRG